MAPVPRPELTFSASQLDDPTVCMETNIATYPVAPVKAMHTLLHNQYSRIAQAVAALLSPAVTAAVDKAIAAGISNLRKDLDDHDKCLFELEHHLSDLEDEIQGSQAAEQQFDQTQQYLLEKIDGLENRSRRNNLKIIGLPEYYVSGILHELCATPIPEALGITTPVSWKEHTA